MTTKDLLPNQPVTAKGDLPSQALIEIIQRQNRVIADLLARIAVLEA